MKWDRESFFKALYKRCGETNTKIAIKIWNWSIENQFDIVFGPGKIDGSFAPYFPYHSGKCPLFSLKTYGKIELNFKYYQNYPPFDKEEKRIELMNKLNGVIRADKVTIDRIAALPKMEMKALKDEQKFKEFIGIFEWVTYEIKNLSLNKVSSS